MGEYGRGVVDGENDETCRSITNSCVAFVNANILPKRSENTAWDVPCVLTRFDNLTTILTNTCASSRSPFLSAPGSPHRIAFILVRRRSVVDLALSSVLRNSSAPSDKFSTISFSISHTAGAASTATSIASRASLSTSVREGGISSVGRRAGT